MDSESPLQQAESCAPFSTCMKVVARKESLLLSNGLKENYSEGQRQNSISILTAALKEQMQKEQAKSARWDANGTRLVLSNSLLGKSSGVDKGKSIDKGKSPLGFSSILDKEKSPIGVPSTANNHGQRSVRTCKMIFLDAPYFILGLGSVVSRGVVLQQATVPVKCTEIPSAVASWSGSCRVYHASQQLEDIHKFQAHHPSRVHKKVYEFSKSMTDLLQFEMTSLIWVDIDQHLCRNKRDIGLYISSQLTKRGWINMIVCWRLCKKKSKDYAMRAGVEDRELLVFPSRVLSKNCQQWGGRHFLWRLFWKVDKSLMELKKNQFLIDVEMEEEVDMTEDMDIDMVGGEEIPGRQDSVRPPPSSLPMPPPLSLPMPPMPPPPPILHARPLHVPPPTTPQHMSPPLPPLKRVKIEEKNDYSLLFTPLYVPPPPCCVTPPPPLKRVKIEGKED